MVGAASAQAAARAALTAGVTVGGAVSGAHPLNAAASACGLGPTHRPVPLRLPDLFQQTAAALPAWPLSQAPQGSSLGALASMVASSAEHPRANAAGGLPLAMAQKPTLMDVPSAGPRWGIGDQGGPWLSQDKTGLQLRVLDMSLQAAQARALSAEIDRRTQELVQSYLQQGGLLSGVASGSPGRLGQTLASSSSPPRPDQLLHPAGHLSGAPFSRRL